MNDSNKIRKTRPRLMLAHTFVSIPTRELRGSSSHAPAYELQASRGPESSEGTSARTAAGRPPGRRNVRTAASPLSKSRELKLKAEKQKCDHLWERGARWDGTAYCWAPFGVPKDHRNTMSALIRWDLSREVSAVEHDVHHRDGDSIDRATKQCGGNFVIHLPCHTRYSRNIY